MMRLPPPGADVTRTEIPAIPSDRGSRLFPTVIHRNHYRPLHLKDSVFGHMWFNIAGANGQKTPGSGEIPWDVTVGRGNDCDSARKGL